MRRLGGNEKDRVSKNMGRLGGNEKDG